MRVLPSSSFGLWLLAAPLLPGQDPGQVLAKFRRDGAEAFVTKADVALEMAFHLRRRDEGRQAVEVLVDAVLTRRAARAKGLWPTEAEIRAFWDDLAAKLRAAGKRVEDFAAVRNSSEAELFAHLAVQIAQERLVRAELGLSTKETVSGGMLKLWLQEERRKARVITDPEQLPAGVAARVDATDVPIADLGQLLLQTCEPEEQTRFVQQVAYLQSIEAMARAHGITITAADIDAAVAQRRADAAKDPRYQGLGFEQLLESQGLTVAALRDLRVFRAQILLARLCERLHPDPELRRELAENRAAVLEQAGPRRRLGLIFVRALEHPNALIPNDFPAAMARLGAARQRLAEERFENVARIESDEPISKQKGGDIGWQNRAGKALPAHVMAAAWQLAPGEVTEPLRGDDGCYLVKVLDVEPDLDDATLLARLRELRSHELKQRIAKDLAIEPIEAATGRR